MIRLGRIAVAAAALAIAVPALAAGPVLKILGAKPRAIVTVDNVRQGRVGADGTLTLRSLAAGRHTVVVTQLGFSDSVSTVTLSGSAIAVVRPKAAPLTDKAELARQRAADLALDGENEKAVAEYERAIALKGARFASAEVGLARVLFTLKQFDRALAAAGASIEHDPKTADAHAIIGNVLRERGLYEDAAVEYRKAIALRPGSSPEGYTGLGLALGELGQTEEAIRALEKGVAQNADTEPVLYQILGDALERAGRRDAAIAAYRRYLALAPKGPYAPAVRSILERLDAPEDTQLEEGDRNPFTPPTL